MFKIKKDLTIDIDSQKNFAEDIGIAEETLSRIINRKQSCSKVLAYAIAKNINSDFEINDLFDYIEE